ncbi:MAG: Zn-dependent alcohol dehydrogenase [Thermomicrobiales bacterium]
MRTMKAAVLYDYNTPLVIEQVQLDDPGPNEVLVKIAASGVCRSDYHSMKGEVRPPLPVVLGHEAAGRIVEVGANVTRVRPGDPIIVCFAPYCGHCEYCTSGRQNLCETRRSGMLLGGSARRSKDGQPINGSNATFAEYTILHESGVVPVGPDVPLEVGALIGCAVTTGVGAVLNTAQVPPGSTVAVIGCGGVGLNVIQGARLVNASRIIAVDISLDKLEFARRFGATDLIDAREENPVQAIRQLTNGGVDYAFEVLGSAATVRTAFDVIHQGGTAVAVGLAATGEEAPIDINTLVLSEKTLKGSFYGSSRTTIDMPKYLNFVRAGRLDLDAQVTRRYALEEINEAYDALNRGEVGRGLIVFAE